MRFLPVFLDLAAGTVVLVGSGEAAASKLRLLRAAGARVRWHVHDAARAHEVADDAVEIIADPLPDQIDLSDAIAVVAAAGAAEGVTAGAAGGAAACFCSAALSLSQVAKSALERTSTTMGMKA